MIPIAPIAVREINEKSKDLTTDDELNEINEKLKDLTTEEKSKDTTDDELNEIKIGKVNIKGFISNHRVKGKRGFITIRSGLDTIQCTYSSIIEEDGLSVELFNQLKEVSTESFIKISGNCIKTSFEIKNCSIRNLEIQICNFSIISKSSELPFSLRDLETVAKIRNSKNISSISYNKCLDFRSLDLRTLQSQSIFRIIDGLMFYFRDFLRKSKFIEIKTSKLIDTASEGGSNCFQLDYFGKKAYLAQSPQLYKQMAIIGGFKKVYEVSHVYRAEESNINRYLSEFVGLDLEMEIDGDYNELIEFIYKMLIYIFESLNEEYSEEIEIVRQFRPFRNLKFKKEAVVYSHKECILLLRNEGIEIGDLDDFNREAEKRLGEIVLKKDEVDLFVIRKYPRRVRAFYTKGLENDADYSCSFDFILRGEEVLSGAQRISDYQELIESVENAGVDKSTLKGYLNAFKYGVPIHGGCGIGLERILKAYFDFGDIRYFSMFPRDPSRIYP